MSVIGRRKDTILFESEQQKKMTNKQGKSAYLMLGLGVVVGGFAVASLPRIIPSVHAQQSAMARPIAGISTENMAMLRNLDNSFASLADYAQPSVVHIESKSTHETDMFGQRMGAIGGVGSGVVFRPDGWIMTNDHVVAGFETVTVTLNDGRSFPGTVRRAPDSDLAMVKINADNLPAAQFGDSAKVRPGQFAMAVGSPFDFDNSVTIGHISALGRENHVADSRAPNGVRLYADMIQTDAAINMGNSGGPLINIDGQVIGINSAIYSQTGGSMGIGFAIPSNEARMIGETLIEKGKVTKAFLGLVPASLKEYQKKELGLTNGALVMAETNDTPAAMAGIKEKDVIVRIGTFPIRNEEDVRDSMFHFAPGDKVDVEVVRNGKHSTLNVKLGDPVAYQKANAQKSPQLKDDGGDQSMPFPDIKDFGNRPNPFSGTPGPSDEKPLRTGKAKLGVTVEPMSASLRQQFNIPANIDGAVVTTVAPGSVAEGVGLQPGSVIKQIGSKTIHNAQDVFDAMTNVKWGDSVQISYSTFSNNMTMSRSEKVTF